GRVRLSAQLGFVNHDEKTASPGIAPGVRDGVPPNRSESELERFSAALSATAQLSASADAVVGVDYEDESGSLDGTLELAPGFALPTDFNLDRHILGLFVELRAAPTDALALSASVRHDDPSSNDSETTGRLGAQVQVGATRLFASWSEGFKLPSFFALGHALVGNPDLKPEKSTSWEAGLSQSALDDRVNLTAALFRAEYEDLIDFDFDLFTNVNRSQVDTQGFEVALGLRPLDVLRLDAHLTYVDIDVKDSATTLRQRPDWRGGISAVWDLAPTVALTADWLYVDDSFDSSVPTGNATLDGYNRVDLSISWKPTETLRLWAAVDNLFDEDYEEAIGFPALGSRWRAGIRWSL
ncbi:MAG: TonB-dependent receptor, partial [Pseudomonadales bacterium]